MANHITELNQIRWQAVLDTARDAIISIDQNGLVTLFNRAAEEIFGFTATEVVGRNVKGLMPEPYRGEHDGYLQKYQATGVAKAIGRIRHVEARRKNGETFPIELSVSEARIGDEVIYSAIIRDVSERLRAERQLQELQKLAQQRERMADIGAITAQIAHDLGNPLAAISMQAQLILRRAKRDSSQPLETVLDAAEKIVARVAGLNSMVGEFLDFAREQRLHMKDIPVGEFLQGQAAFWEPLAASQQISLAVEVADSRLTVEADAEKLGRVVENLVKNAVEAIGPPGGTVRLRAREQGCEAIRISVEDDGPGLPEGFKAFQLFETTKSNGTGLGLSIARQIVQAHGGAICFDRLTPHGTAFHIDLPRRHEQVNPDDNPAA